MGSAMGEKQGQNSRCHQEEVSRYVTSPFTYYVLAISPHFLHLFESEVVRGFKHLESQIYSPAGSM